MHNVGTTLRLAYHGCENLTHTSKTRFVKRTQLVEMLGSRFACLLLFQTAKNWTQRNRRAKWREVQIRTVARKYSTGRYYICAGRLDILKIWQNVHRSVVFYISIWEAENRALIWGIRPNRAFVIFFVSLFFVSLGKSSVVANRQSDFCLLFKITNISSFLSMGAVQTRASTQ